MARKRWIWVGALAAVIIAVVAGAWAARGQIAYAQIATVYTAKQTCSCLFVSGRTLDSCLADLPPDARQNISVTQDGDLVRASVLFGAIRAEAIHEGEFGCRIAG